MLLRVPAGTETRSRSILRMFPFSSGKGAAGKIATL
jgi:hypothetical protein